MENTNMDIQEFKFPPLTPTQQPRFFPNFTSSMSSPDDQPTYRPNPRKKRTKMIKFTNSILPISSTAATATTSSNLKPKYTKKPDPCCGGSKIPHPCSECGKKFWSWKALFGHMRCHPERQWRGINPPPNLRRPFLQEVRPIDVVMTEDDHEIASCLLMLANGTDNSVFESQCGTSNITSIVEWKSFTKDVEMGFGDLLEGGCSDQEGPSLSNGNFGFECSSCKKVFGSHQALGGHRASHKNVKGCFAITRSDGYGNGMDEYRVDYRNGGEVEEERENMEEKMMMVLGHKCSICLRVFSSGQALGGHKRCHWEKEEEPQQFTRPRQGCGLDLNLPAPLDDNSAYSSYSSSGLTLDLRLGI